MLNNVNYDIDITKEPPGRMILPVSIISSKRQRHMYSVNPKNLVVR